MFPKRAHQGRSISHAGDWSSFGSTDSQGSPPDAPKPSPRKAFRRLRGDGSLASISPIKLGSFRSHKVRGEKQEAVVLPFAVMLERLSRTEEERQHDISVQRTLGAQAEELRRREMRLAGQWEGREACLIDC